MAFTNAYFINGNIAMTNTKKEVCEVDAGSTAPILIGKFSITSALTAATAQEVQFAKFGTGGATMTSATVGKRNNYSLTPGATGKTWASGQTDASTITPYWEREIDLRAGAGVDGLPVPESRDNSATSGIFGLWFPTVLAGTSTLSFEEEWFE